MKVIIAGSTGFIGREVLEQCLQNPSITSIIALARRDLPASITSTAGQKLKVAIIKDFLSYPESVLQDIKGADACIWALGKARMPDNDTNRKVSIEYTLAAAKAFDQGAIMENDKAKKFRFVYLSGGAVERDQTKPLWFMQDYRRIRGQAENSLIEYASEHQDKFEAYIVKPGMVLANDMSVRTLVAGLGPSVKVDVLAAVLLNIALNGSKQQTLDNTAINEVKG